MEPRLGGGVQNEPFTTWIYRCLASKVTVQEGALLFVDITPYPTMLELQEASSRDPVIKTGSTHGRFMFVDMFCIPIEAEGSHAYTGLRLLAEGPS